jgi:Zn-dependent peptidase ImmA (M78 family)
LIFGRPESFAIEVRPLGNGPAGEDPATSATWTAIRIYAEGRNLLRNVTRDSREVSEEISWPSAFLARWFVRSWRDLFHTPPWPRPVTLRNARDLAAVLDEELIEAPDLSDSELDQRDCFVQNHALRAAAAGAAMPDVWFSRDQGVVSVSWHDSMDGSRSFTLSRGEVDVPAADFADAVIGFVQWTSDLMRDAEAPELAKDISELDEWLEAVDSRSAAMDALIAETGLTEQRVSNIQALAGTDSVEELFHLDEAWFERGTRVDTRDSPVAIAFRCVSPALADSDLVRVRRTLLDVERHGEAFDAIIELTGRIVYPHGVNHDFIRGYRMARAVRRELRNLADPLNVEDLVHRELRIPVLDLRLSDPQIDGASVCDDAHGPVVFVNPVSKRASTPWGRSVVIAHELCHLLFDRREARPLTVISGPWAPPRIERVANAFAIELLLPLEGIIATVGRVWQSPQDSDVENLMDKYGVGVTATTEHLRNMRNPKNR